MKYFVVIFLFAFLAGIHGDDFEELLLANDGVPDRNPYVVRMGHLLKVYVKSFFLFVFASDRKRYLFPKKSYNSAGQISMLISADTS